MFTDLVGSTALMARSEEAGLRAKRRHRELVSQTVASYGGDLVEAPGDETLSVFSSALEAVNCALAIAKALESEDFALHLAIHSGDVVLDGNEIHGDGVNIAARLLALSEGGGVCVSGEVYASVRNQPGLEFTDLGTRELKNVGRPVALYAVCGTAAPPTGTPRQPAASRTSAPASRIAVASLALLVLAGLGWWFLGPTAVAEPIRSVAVLPLENLSGDPEQDYFVDGVTEALILEVARIGSLRVISRTSMMRYKGTRQPLPAIAQELGVDALIEGTVNREGDRVRVTVQLIDARYDSHLWAEQYDRELEGILELQSEIASAIARRVEARLTPDQERRFGARPPADPAAHDEYLKGVYFAHKYTPAASLRAREHFEAGMRIDPEYALPYAGLADALSCSPLHSWAVPAEGANALPQAVMDQAREMANRAMELDGELPETHVALALVDIFRHQDWSEAERHSRFAMELNPSHEFAHRSLALVLMYQGRFEEAIERIERARQIDPFNPFVASLAGDVYWHSGDSEKAISLWQEAGEIDAGHPLGFQGLGMARCKRGELDEAVALFNQARRLSAEDPTVVADLGYCYASAGETDKARALLRELEARSPDAWVSPANLALIHLGLGEHDAALDQLARAYEIRATYWLVELGVDRRWNPLRGDPRFVELLARMGLGNTAEARTEPPGYPSVSAQSFFMNAGS
jgi:TolB-like protein/Flp pilus assembly protein TadD